ASRRIASTAATVSSRSYHTGGYFVAVAAARVPAVAETEHSHRASGSGTAGLPRGSARVTRGVLMNRSWCESDMNTLETLRSNHVTPDLKSPTSAVPAAWIVEAIGVSPQKLLPTVGPLRVPPMTAMSIAAQAAGFRS